MLPRLQQFRDNIFANLASYVVILIITAVSGLVLTQFQRLASGLKLAHRVYDPDNRHRLRIGCGRLVN